MEPTNEVVHVTLIAADPFTTEADQLEEEAEVIKEALQIKNRNADVSFVHARSEKELSRRLKKSSPQIVEFTGHGSPNTRIIMEDASKRIRQKTGRSIAALLSRAELNPECVLFNNCSAKGNTEGLINCADNFIQVQCDGVFDISLGFAQNFYAHIALEREYGYALEHALGAMKEEGIPIGPRTGIWQRQASIESTQLSEIEMANERVRLKPGFALSQDAAGPPDSATSSKAIKPIEEANQPRKHVVWFATNRQPSDVLRPEIGFGTNYDETIHYGKCEIAIPKYHKRGSVGTPFWKRWPVWHNDRLSLISTQVLTSARFWLELRACMDAQSQADKYVLLFIHGYNVTFKQAVVRAGQIGADLNVLGATALFSWPSKGRPRSYPADEASVAPSAVYLSQFLYELAANAGAEEVHVVAHSMGNRAFLQALVALLTQVSQSTKLRFNQFFLAAPDIDVRDFRQLAAAYSKLSKRTTMYVSSKDKALWGSKILHEYPRAGYHPPITIVDGVDTVEVSNIDVSFLGHSYIAEADALLYDMHSLMLANPPPARRMGLTSVLDSLTGLKYWKMRD